VAFDFYETRRRGLGIKFALEVGIGISTILEAPRRWPEIEPGYRKNRLDPFPYALIYHLPTPQILEIVAVFDLRRQPGSWRNNLSS
jgi:hypothetical protein